MAALATSSDSPPAGPRPAERGRSSRSHRLLVDAGLLLAGCLAGGAGAGLGVRHLVKEGWSWGSALGLLLLVLGVCSLAVVLRRCWRSSAAAR